MEPKGGAGDSSGDSPARSPAGVPPQWQTNRLPRFCCQKLFETPHKRGERRVMKDWKKIADASELNIPEADFARITPALDSLEKSFRPLVQSLSPTLEPAFVF